MNNNLVINLHELEKKNLAKEIEVCNDFTCMYGLTLTTKQIVKIINHKDLALKETGRIEFGESIIKKLIYAFCDSPYINQKDYLDTMIELQDIFYYFKNETKDILSDDELIAEMSTKFNTDAQGSIEYLEGTLLEALSRKTRGGDIDE